MYIYTSHVLSSSLALSYLPLWLVDCVGVEYSIPGYLDGTARCGAAWHRRTEDKPIAILIPASHCHAQSASSATLSFLSLILIK